MATQTPDYRSVRHQEESNSTPASHPAVQFSSPVPVLVNQSVTQQPKHFIDLCDIRDFLLLFSNRSDFLVIPEDELPGLVKLKTL
jgi:hypothetical protein